MGAGSLNNPCLSTGLQGFGSLNRALAAGPGRRTEGLS